MRAYFYIPALGLKLLRLVRILPYPDFSYSCGKWSFPLIPPKPKAEKSTKGKFADIDRGGTYLASQSKI
jgi:hypothetical protein